MSGRPRSQRDDLIVASLHGAASRHAGWREPTGPARELAIIELRDIATHDRTLRTDLLAAVAGLCLARGQQDDVMAPHYRIRAGLLLDAGADPDLLEHWTAVGLERVTRAAERMRRVR